MKWSCSKQIVLVAVAMCMCVIGAARPLHADPQSKPADFEYSDREFSKDLLTFFRSSWIETYRTVGHRDDVWDKPALNFLEKFCESASNLLVWRGLVADDAIHDDELRKIGQAVMNRHCDDPQVRAAFGMTLLSNGATRQGLRELRAALPGLNDEKHPAYNIIYVCNLLLQAETSSSWEPGEFEAVNTAAVNAVVRCMSNVQPTRAERYIRFRAIHLLTVQSEKIRIRIAVQLKTAKNIDPWLLEVFTGEFETRQAWAIRGGGFANTVTPQGWRGFAEHLQKSREHLLSAFKIDPAVPGPAYLMITVAMGQGTEGDDSPRAWFIRARSAKMDDQWALESLLWSLRPRWGGSYEQLLSLGKELAASNRFDTKVPMWLVDAIWAISSDRKETNAASFGEPEAYEALKTMFEGYARSLPDGNGRNYVRSQQAAVAYVAGRYADARTVMDQLGPKLVRYTFSYFTKDADLAVSQVYAMTGPHADDVRRAVTEAETLDPNALKHFTELAATCKPTDPEGYFYNSFLSKLQFEKDFEAGNWVDVQPRDALYLWQPMQGQWLVNGDKLIGTCNGTGLLLRFKFKTGEAFEVEGKLAYEPDGKDPNACGIFCDHNMQTWANGVFYSVGYRDVSWYVNGKTGVVSHPLEKENRLHLSMQYGKLSATINGQPVPIPAMNDPANDLGADARICIGGLYPETPMSVTITGLKVRKSVPGKN